MITDEDIKKIAKKFATKNDLTLEMIKTRAEFKKDLTELEHKFDKKFDRILNLTDAVLGEVKAMREEQAAHAQRHDDIDADLKVIKSIPTIALQLGRR